MDKNIWIISQTNSHILTQIVTDNFMLLDLIDEIQIFNDINSKGDLATILESIPSNDKPYIYYIFEDKDLSSFAREFCISKNINSINIYELVFSFFYKTISERLQADFHEASVNNINEEFVDFALQADDGKNSKSFLDADIIIIGVSRTTKTPLSIYLSNLGYRVANLPLLPEVKIPDEIYQIDKNRIFALYMESNRIERIRKRRLERLGLPIDSIYADITRIEDELSYAHKISKELACKIIDVSSISIEETADIIINTMKR